MKKAVFLLAHGSPDAVEEIPEFLLQITRGRPLAPEVIAEVQHRYGLIGCSPLTCHTLQQGTLLSNKLGMPVYVGMRNWKPFIADVIKTMAADRITHAVVICLAPQNSRTSVGLYRAALSRDGEPPFAVDFVESWHDHPLLIQAFAEKFNVGWSKACTDAGTKVPVVFTAHSVPQRTIAEGDPYELQTKETAARVAKFVGLNDDDSSFAFQSQGMSGGAWLGPTVEDTILALKARGHSAVFVQPIGFLCDHVEILYDIDIGFQEFARGHGITLSRAESLNDSPWLTSALAEIVNSRGYGV
ncbi:MAG TPA: ferrochelatase [Terriglobales bacterium]|jgi:ferrochelatase|nr:ferrochelatase [Terriglobales bacterium]